VTDNRTGKQYEIDLHNHAFSAADLMQIKNPQGIATRCIDLNLSNTAICTSQISLIEDGNAEYRGIPIKSLLSKSKLTEVYFLLLYGDLPNQRQLKNFEARIRGNYSISSELQGLVGSITQQSGSPIKVL